MSNDILYFKVNDTGQDGEKPRKVRLVTKASLATLTTAGFLDNIVKLQGQALSPTDEVHCWYGATSLTVPGTFSIFNPTISNGSITLVQWVNPGNALLPVTSGNIATFNGTTGQIGDISAPAVHGGNIQAGLSGTAGTLASFPTTASRGSLIVAGVANTGNTNTTISNAAMGQASVISIPDPGTATSNFIIADSAGTQHITTGSLSVDLGNIAAGSSGHAGTISSFPGTAANGQLILAGVNAGGAFNTTISNGTMAQSTVYTLGDIGAATGGIPVATTSLRIKSVAQAVVAGGAAAQTVTDAFCTSTSTVVCTWNDTTNAASIQKVVAGNGSFVVTSTVDPGASHLNYIITK